MISMTEQRKVPLQGVKPYKYKGNYFVVAFMVFQNLKIGYKSTQSKRKLQNMNIIIIYSANSYLPGPPEFQRNIKSAND